MQIPIQFPTELERLRRSIEANKNLTYLERVQAIDGILNTIDLFAATSEKLPGRNRLRQMREEEGHRCFREFIQRQLAKQSTNPRAAE